MSLVERVTGYDSIEIEESIIDTHTTTIPIDSESQRPALRVPLKGTKIIIASTRPEQLLVLVSELSRVDMHVEPVALNQIPILGNIHHGAPPVL
jgi:hypothetical protein